MTVTVAELVEAGLLTPGTVRLARHLGFLYGEDADPVIMAAACCVAALATGSVCFDLGRPDQVCTETAAAVDWPEPVQWAAVLGRSPMVSVDPAVRDRPLILDAGLVYLTRSWAEQDRCVTWLAARLDDGATPGDAAAGGTPPGTAPPGSAPPGTDGDASQRAAVALAARASFCVIAGGPGTGKTTTVGRLLAALAADRGEPLRVILTAPTGRAAARLEQAVRESLTGLGVTNVRSSAGTVHRILGIKPWGATDKDAEHPLAADLVVVDEASMLSLHLMYRLLDAIPPATRLVLLGDPDQLASVEAGAVLGDIVANAGPVPVARLTHTYRFSGAIAALADAIRAGDADQALAILETPSPEIEWLPADPEAPGFSPDHLTALRDSLTGQALALIAAARDGDPAAALRLLDSHRLLLAYRHGPAGVAYWTQTVRRWLAHEPGGPPTGLMTYTGLPVLITRNDDLLGIFNGDAGVLVGAGGELKLALADGPGCRYIAPEMIDAWEPVYASTIHKAQGSQYDAVSLILPPAGTPLLTRELFYTAVTRAKSFLRLVATPEAIRQGVASPAVRASGLADQLRRAASPRPPATR